MKRLYDIEVGQVFGSWTVISKCRNVKGVRCGNCRCECGEVKEVIIPDLATGKSTKCSKCLKEKRRVKVEKGQVFNDWTVLREVEKIGDKRAIECICKCGEIDIIRLGELTNGRRKQCRKCVKKNKENEFKVGQVFGKWTAIKEVEPHITKGGNKQRIIRCKCVCGTLKNIPFCSLLSGSSKQCRECKTAEQFMMYRISKGLDPDTPMTPRRDAERKLFANSLRIKILIRDKTKCQMCFNRAEAVHHIIPWTDCYKQEDQHLRYDPENCISLCKECHLKAHDGNTKNIDYEIAEQLMTKAIENTEKHPELFEGMAEEINKKLAEIS